MTTKFKMKFPDMQLITSVGYWSGIYQKDAYNSLLDRFTNTTTIHVCFVVFGRLKCMGQWIDVPRLFVTGKYHCGAE